MGTEPSKDCKRPSQKNTNEKTTTTIITTYIIV